VHFFIPHLQDDPEAAEIEWQRYLEVCKAPPHSGRVYSMTYEHDGERIIATVGQAREVFEKRRGPMGGYIKNAGYLPIGRPSGTIVSGIVHATSVIHTWSYGPPFGGWVNPSLVGPKTVTKIEFFD
jgi:hypothetical protein